MLEKLYFSLLDKISPENLVKNHLEKNNVKFKENVIAIGKAALPMISSFYSFAGYKKGLAVSPFKGNVPENTELCVSTHPNISEKSIFCGKKVIEFFKSADKGITILLSGGGSALVEYPLNFLTLNEIRCVNDLMLKSGAPIEDINFVRIHLSALKGGGLLNFIPGDGECLVLCDVLGNRVDRVSSAPFYRVDRDFEKFAEYVKLFGLDKCLSREKIFLLKKTKFPFKRDSIPHRIIADNSYVVSVFKAMLEKKGFECFIPDFEFKDLAEVEAEKLFSLFKETEKNGKYKAFVGGGEVVVKVKGMGKGGRTLEFCLRFLRTFVEKKIFPSVEILFATTDGMDGNSNAAGVFVSRETLKNILKNESLSSIDSYLAESNSASFFEKYNALIKTGYTGNNLLDIYSFAFV